MLRLTFFLICTLMMANFILFAFAEEGEDKEKSKDQKVRPEVKEALESKYPVAIPKGKSVNFQYQLPEKGELKFSVTDFKGEEHFGFTETFEAGDNTISFNTFGLEVGNYLVKISSPKKKEEKEMMLTVVK